MDSNRDSASCAALNASSRIREMRTTHVRRWLASHCPHCQGRQSCLVGGARPLPQQHGARDQRDFLCYPGTRAFSEEGTSYVCENVRNDTSNSFRRKYSVIFNITHNF